MAGCIARGGGTGQGVSDRLRVGPVHHFSYWTARRQTAVFFTYLQREQMLVSHLITHRFQPTEAAEVYRRLAEKRTETLGVLFDWR